MNSEKVTRFDKRSCRPFSDEVMKTLAAIEAQMGVRFSYKGGEYSKDGGNFIMRIEAGVVDASGRASTKESSAFVEMHRLFGLQRDDLWKKVTIGGKEATIIGLLPGRSAHPILLEYANKEKKMHTIDGVLKALGRPKTPATAQM